MTHRLRGQALRGGPRQRVAAPKVVQRRARGVRAVGAAAALAAGGEQAVAGAAGRGAWEPKQDPCQSTLHARHAAQEGDQTMDFVLFAERCGSVPERPTEDFRRSDHHIKLV